MNTAAIGIDFGGTSVKFGVVKGCKIIDTPSPIPTQSFPTRDSLIGEICKVVERIKLAHPEVAAIGVGVPGFVNFEKGVISNLTNVLGWQNVPFRDILSEKTGLPVTIDNDANAMAYAEWKLGAGRGFKDLVCLTLGTGVGGGIIANGQMIRGANFGAGELGQTSIDYRGRMGTYGNPGSLEEYIGNREIIQEAIRFYKHDGIQKTADEITPAYLSELALTGDETALKIWHWVAEKLACTMMNCCYLLNPAAFVIGGGVAKAGDLIFEPLREKLNKWVIESQVESLEIIPAQFGNDAGIIGCAALALEQAGLCDHE